MFRRSRFSIRPNVSTAGRTAATSQDAPSASQEASETPRDVSESSAALVTDTKSVATPSEKPIASGDGDDQNGEGTSSSAAVQRRKRFSVKPKVAPGRPSTHARTPKSPVKALSETSCTDKSCQTATTASPKGLHSPKRRRPSEEGKQPKVPPQPTLVPSDSSGPSAVPLAEESLEQTDPPADDDRRVESKSANQVKEVPPRPDKVPPSIPNKEVSEISEKAKTLVSSKSELSLPPSAFSLSRLLNDPSDLQRLAKAQKLRELLRQERHKEKKIKKAKTRVKEYTLDPAKMTMRDLIRYLPLSNPMTTSLEDSAQENETVVPPSPRREESPERVQEPEVLPKMASPREEEEEEAAEEEQEEALMVPQVKVAEDGSLIIDEESLTVEVQRAKGPNPAQDRDPIFERGSTTTYSSFRKGTYSKPWSNEETDMFFLAISMVGTDFSIICQLFPHRARSEIKNKFKKEERENGWRIDKAFRERRKLDIEYFSKLLEKILEFQKSRKKLKSLSEKNSPKKHKKKAKGAKAARKLSDVEEEDEEDENQVPDLEDEEEGEKENEDLFNEGGTSVSKPKRPRKRKSKQAALNEEPNDKKNKTGGESNEQGEARIPEDTEAALPEDLTSSEMSEKAESKNASKDTTIKPAKLSRGRAPKPLLPLGRKWGKKPPPSSTQAKDTASDEGDGSVSDGASKEQVNKDSSPESQANNSKSADSDSSSEEEDAAVRPPRPTRYGRVPKPTKPLTYPAKEDAQPSVSDTSPTSPAGSAAPAAKPRPKQAAKRGRSSKQQSAQEPKKPKLITLRASQSEYSDEEDEKQQDHGEIEEEEEELPACSPSKDSAAPVFVPASLRSPHPVISEVEETMEELDILANMPDVLGISQVALCPDAYCEQAQNETGTAEPCEHQLDLLVDVIDLLSSEHTQVSEDESYNEAAQTLLTIGNLAHLPQSGQNQLATEDHTTGTMSLNVKEARQQLEEETAAQEENGATPLMSGHGVTETSETVATAEPQNVTTDNADGPVIKTSDQTCGEQREVSDMDLGPQSQPSPESSKKNPPQAKRGRLTKVKPKPNLGRASRTAQPKSQADASTEQTAEETNAEAADPQVTGSVSAPEETAPEIPECSPALLMEDVLCTEVKLAEEFAVGQEGSVDQVESAAATSDQSSSENQCPGFSDALFELGGEQASRDTRATSESSDENPICHAEIISSCMDNSAAVAVTESQVEQESTTYSSTVQEDSQRSAAFDIPVEDLPLSKKEGEVASSCQPKRSRLQRVKPKPNVPQTSRTALLTPQTSKKSAGKDSSPAPISTVHEETRLEVEPKANCGTSPEKPSQSTGPALVSIPSLDSGSALTATQELSETEEKRADAGLVGQVFSGVVTSDQSASENRSLSEAPFDPSSRDTGSTTESTAKKGTNHDGAAECSTNPETSDSAVTELQVGKDPAPVQQTSDHPATCFTPVDDLSVTQKEESLASTCQTLRGRLQKVKPRPNLEQTSRTARCKPQTMKDPAMHTELVERPTSPGSKPKSVDNTIADLEAQPVCSNTLPIKPDQSTGTASVSVPSLELCPTHKTTEESSSAMEQETDVGLNSSSATSEPNAPQRRRQFPKVKPNLGPSTRATQTKLQPRNVSKPSEPQHSIDMVLNVTSEQQAVDSSKTEPVLAETDVKHSTSTHSPLSTELSLTPAPAESEETLGSTNDEADSIVIATPRVAENQSTSADSVPENKGSEKSTLERVSAGGKMSDNDREEVGPASQVDSKLDMSNRVTESNTQPPDDSTAVSDAQSSEGGSAESKLNYESATRSCSTPDPKESGPQPCSGIDSEVQCQDETETQCSETREADQTPKDKSQSAQSTDETQPELIDSSKSSKQACQTRRGRLIKPKPNLGRSSRPPLPQQVQNTTQAEADSGTSSEGVDASVSHKPSSKSSSDLQGPVEGAIELQTKQESLSNDSGSSLGRVTEVPDSLSQNASTTNTAVTQSLPSVTIFPEMLSEQVPSDPDEPFFILSLTEIPVCSSGEVVDCPAGPFSYLPVADASIQQQSNVPGVSLAVAGDGSLSNVPVPMATEASGEMGLSRLKETGPDSAARIDSITENPVDPHDSTTVQPPKLPETVENNDATAVPPTKQRPRGTGRRAKVQVKPSTKRKTRASKTLATNPDWDSELPGSSKQPEASDATAKTGDKSFAGAKEKTGDCVNLEKETSAGGRDPEDSSSGAQCQTTKTSGTSFENSTAPSSDPLPGKAASKGPKVKSPRTTRKHSTSTPVASTSRGVASTASPTRLQDETHATSSATSPTLTLVDIEQTAKRSQPCPDPTPSTSQCTAEDSASQKSGCAESSSAEEEEPTSVSQYFLSDIFTDVEEG